jgi:hypothetical protein
MQYTGTTIEWLPKAWRGRVCERSDVIYIRIELAFGLPRLDVSNGSWLCKKSGTWKIVRTNLSSDRI